LFGPLINKKKKTYSFITFALTINYFFFFLPSFEVI